MKSLIFNNKVVDVQEAEFPVHNSMTWVDCGDEVKIGIHAGTMPGVLIGSNSKIGPGAMIFKNIGDGEVIRD